MSLVVRAIAGVALAAIPTTLAIVWVGQAQGRLAEAEGKVSEAPTVAIAEASNEEYCNADLKKVLRRVLLSCGLADGGGRGCQPVDAKNVATMAGEDFNALFLPLSQRASIIQFGRGEVALDTKDKELLGQTFAQQGGASYFLVVSRASPDGKTENNRELSRQRAESVMEHLRKTFTDPDLEREVGLLWLGEEFAQLDKSFCEWSRSGGKDECGDEHLNRSAFVAWIDCRL